MKLLGLCLKTSIVVGGLGAGALFAQGAEIKITSFVMAGSRTNAAELCGKVTGLNESAVIKVLVDEKGETPGIYYSHVEKDGAFCTAVVTYLRTASAVVLPPAGNLMPPSEAAATEYNRSYVR